MRRLFYTVEQSDSFSARSSQWIDFVINLHLGTAGMNTGTLCTHKHTHIHFKIFTHKHTKIFTHKHTHPSYTFIQSILNTHAHKPVYTTCAHFCTHSNTCTPPSNGGGGGGKKCKTAYDGWYKTKKIT